MEPNDFVMADEDGVVVVPRSNMEEVLKLCIKGREVDGKCMQDLNAGRSVKETFAKHRGK